MRYMTLKFCYNIPEALPQGIHAAHPIYEKPAVCCNSFLSYFNFQLQSMLKKNETLPDIEQLNRHEFDLDIEEQLKLQAEADQEVERVSKVYNWR